MELTQNNLQAQQDKLIGFALLGRQLQHHRTEWLEKLNSCPSTV
ncbi:hypothetical protein ABTJ99_18985 [Acinetobacter baumannii]